MTSTSRTRSMPLRLVIHCIILGPARTLTNVDGKMQCFDFKSFHVIVCRSHLCKYVTPCWGKGMLCMWWSWWGAPCMCRILYGIGQKFIKKKKQGEGVCRKVQVIKPQLEENVRIGIEHRNPSRPSHVYVLVIRIHPTASVLRPQLTLWLELELARGRWRFR